MTITEKRIAVVLAGCGVFDGSEIHEATCTLLNIADKGASYQCFAPNAAQPSVINHYTKQEEKQSRNMLEEAARIARGNIKDVKEFNPDQFDAVIFPGGQGAAKNLCNFAFKGAECDVNEDVRKAIEAAYEKALPIGAICIAPALIARVLGSHGIGLTIGNDPATAAQIEKTGAHHHECEAVNAYVDKEHKIVSTPAYMLASSIAEVNAGIGRLVEEVLKLCR